MSLTIYQVDSFTSEPFKGNPAGVCILESMASDQWLQSVAAEMNLSETAFLVPQESDNDAARYQLRWFTPAVEVDLCGHATLAATKVLVDLGIVKEGRAATFETRSGLLTAQALGEKIELDFPSTPAVECDVPDQLLTGLNVDAIWCGKTNFDYLVEVDSAKTVRTCSPDFGILKSFGVRGVMVTAKSDVDDYDFISRFFAPGAGIDEDPVTGSAHCALAPYWQAKLNKNELVGFQASARGGVVDTKVEGDRVRLRGNAITILKCELLV